MQSLHYTITFYSDWHIGSGLTQGAANAAIPLTDAEGFPYIPGKTVKGLLKDAFHDLKVDQAKIDLLFGTPNDGVQESEEKETSEKKTGKRGACFFANAELPSTEKKGLEGRKNLLFRSVTSTKIDEHTGTALDESLRSMEITIPLTLQGEIHFLEEIEEETHTLIKQSMGGIKYLGINRTRGLGRCDVNTSTKTQP